MPSADPHNSYTLTPSWKYFFFPYLLSVLTIPILIGLVALYFVRKKHKSMSYRISNTQIAAVNSRYQQNLDLVDIQNIKLDQSWLQKKLGIGCLVIQTSTSNMELAGLEKPGDIQEILEQAVQTLREQPEATTRETVSEPEYGPGSMEKINYLTGLWQQGLISDEDYEKERKHFE